MIIGSNFRYGISTQNASQGISTAFEPAAQAGSRVTAGLESRTGMDGFLYAGYDVEQILRERNLIVDDKSASAVRSLLKNELPATRESILKLVDLRSKMDFMVGGLTREVAAEIASENEFTTDINSLYHSMKRILESMSGRNLQTSEAGYPPGIGGGSFMEVQTRIGDSANAEGQTALDREVEEKIRQIYGTTDVGEQQKKIARLLIQENIPVTLKNIQVVKQYIHKAGSLQTVSSDGIAIVVGKNQEASIQSLSAAEEYVQHYQVQELSDRKVEELTDAVRRILHLSGMEANDENMAAAAALLKNKVDITKENIERYRDIQYKITELAGILSEEAGVGLLKEGRQVEAIELEKLIDGIKELLSASTRYRGDAARAYEDSGTGKLYAGLSRSDWKHPDEEKHLEGEIRKTLDAIGVEASEETVAAARALIKADIEVNKENLEKFMKYLKAFAGMEEESESMFTGILYRNREAGTAEMQQLLDHLRVSGEAVRFLEGEASPKLLQVRQLLNKIEGLRSRNYLAVAFLMRNNLEVNIRNAGTAFAVIHSGAANYIDIKAGSQFDVPAGSLIYPKSLRDGMEASLSQTITQKLIEFDMPVEEEVMQIGRALIQNTLSLSKSNMVKVYDTQFTISSLAALSQREGCGQVFERLMEQGMDLERCPADKLVQILESELAAGANGDKGTGRQGSGESAAGIYSRIALLREFKDDHIALAMKYNIPMDIDKINHLRLLTENKTSLGMEIRELESYVNQLSGDSEEHVGIRTALAALKRALPGTNLRSVKEGLDISEIYSEIVRNVKKMEEEAVQAGASGGDPLLKLTGRIRDTLEMQQQMNREQVFFQLPVIYNNRTSSLKVYVFDRKSSRKLAEGDEVNVLLGLETESLGRLDVRLDIQNRSIKLAIDVEDEGDRRFLSTLTGELSKRITGAGFTLRGITCETRQEGEKREKLLAGDSKNKEEEIRKQMAPGRRNRSVAGFEARV